MITPIDPWPGKPPTRVDTDGFEAAPPYFKYFKTASVRERTCSLA